MNIGWVVSFTIAMVAISWLVYGTITKYKEARKGKSSWEEFLVWALSCGFIFVLSKYLLYGA